MNVQMHTADKFPIIRNAVNVESNRNPIRFVDASAPLPGVGNDTLSAIEPGCSFDGLCINKSVTAVDDVVISSSSSSVKFGKKSLVGDVNDVDRPDRSVSVIVVSSFLE